MSGAPDAPDERAPRPASPPSLQPVAPLQALLAAPERYGFFQAVRLLQRATAGSDTREPLRFGVTDSLSFPAGEIQQLHEAPDGVAAHYRMQVNFFGLTGPSGVLPHHYTRWLIARARARDRGPGDFFELFNHRLLWLFWQAWRKHRPELAIDTGRDGGPVRGLLRHVYDLIGMGTPALFERLYPRMSPRMSPRTGRGDGDAVQRLPAAALGYYSGLVAQRPHGPDSLAQVVGDVVGAPVQVRSCVGSWQQIPAGDRTRLGRQAHGLGAGCVLGPRYWDRQTTLQLWIGPLDRARFQSLLPSGERLGGVVELVRFLTGLALDLRIRLVLRAAQVPPIALGAAGADAPRLGWNTWLGGRRRATAADEARFHFSAMGGESWQ